MDSARELVSDSPRFTAEEIAASFIASAGSPEAQTLFIIGLALAKGISLEIVAGELEESYRSLNLKEKQFILQEMAHGHKTSKIAKETIRGSRQKFKEANMDELLLSQLPDSPNFMVLKMRIEGNDRVTQEQVDRALMNAFGDGGNSQKTINEVKKISAYLGLYTQNDWWKRMSEDERREMRERGRELVGGN